jgi:hypothetical protein
MTMIKHLTRWTLIVFVGLEICLPSIAFATLNLYDDFNSPSVSNSLWTKDVAGAGTVTFNGSQAIIDMSSSTANKHARMILPFTPALSNLGGQLEVAWDQQIVTDGANAFDAGFGLTAGSTVLDAGQRGQVNGNAGFGPHHFVISNGNLGSVDGGTLKHQFDLIVTPSVSTLAVYQYNSDFDATPDSYTSMGTLVTTLTSSPVLSVSASAPLTLLFFSEDQAGDDNSGSFNARAAISVDNVFTNLPEPTTVALPLVVVALFRTCRQSRCGRGRGRKRESGTNV